MRIIHEAICISRLTTSATSIKLKTVSPSHKTAAGWQRAVAFSAQGHAGQCDSDGETPYVAHSARVPPTILSLCQCNDCEVTAGALLHDVIEKTDTTYDEIAAECGVRVAGMIAVLSRDHRLPAAKAKKPI
ncbi:MAG: HD domain-containing protein [Chthoniobacteraceae bacterium]